MSARVQFAFSLKEQAALNRRMCRLLYGPLGGSTLSLAPVVLVGAAVALAAGLSGFVDPQNEVQAFFVLLLVFGLPAILGSRWLTVRLARRATRAATLEGVSCTVEVQPQHLVWSGPEWRYEIAWSGIDRIDDGPDAVMLVFRGTGYFAPRRAFADDAARTVFVAACVERLTPEAKARSGLAA